MNKKEVLDLILKIENYYNNPFTRNLSPDETREQKIIKVVDSWHLILSDQEYKKVMQNFKKHVTKSKFPPTIAELYEENVDSKVNHEHLAYMRRLRSGQLD
ncbi:replicative helicase loader/inhibitor [Sutcliffiella cohnii]